MMYIEFNDFNEDQIEKISYVFSTLIIFEYLLLLFYQVYYMCFMHHIEDVIDNNLKVD